MGFALWVEDGLACAEGTHEYRPMGAAVISATDLFRDRHFRGVRRRPRFSEASYVGLFGSLVDVNSWLRQRRRPTAAGASRLRSPGPEIGRRAKPHS